MIEKIKYYLGIGFIGITILLISFFYFIMINDLYTIANNNILEKGKIIEAGVSGASHDKPAIGFDYIIKYKNKELFSSSLNSYAVGDEVLFLRLSFNNAKIMYVNGKKMSNKFSSTQYVEIFVVSLLTMIFIIIIKNKLKSH